MKLFQITLLVLLIYGCTPNVREELNAVDNEATFKSNVSSFMEFTEHFRNEDTDKLIGMFADTVLWSPPVYNGYEWLGKEAMIKTFEGYFREYEICLWIISSISFVLDSN